MSEKCAYSNIQESHSWLYIVQKGMVMCTSICPMLFIEAINVHNVPVSKLEKTNIQKHLDFLKWVKKSYNGPWLVWLRDWVLACKVEGRLFDSQSGRTPGFQAGSPVWGAQEATTHWLMFLSLSLKKTNKKQKQKNLKWSITFEQKTQTFFYFRGLFRILEKDSKDILFYITEFLKCVHIHFK